jgi:hypothetical protein
MTSRPPDIIEEEECSKAPSATQFERPYISGVQDLRGQVARGSAGSLSSEAPASCSPPRTSSWR